MPHPHTSEAHHTTLINTHPKLFSQPSSAHIRSSSLNPHQHTSEALLSSHTKQSPKLRISINQSISQPIRPTIFFHNYIQNTPKINLNITQKHHTLSKTASIPQSPHDKSPKTHPTHIQRSADALPPPGKPPHLTPPKTRTDRLPAGRLHGRDPVRRSKPLVILGA